MDKIIPIDLEEYLTNSGSIHENPAYDLPCDQYPSEYSDDDDYSDELIDEDSEETLENDLELLK